MIWRDRSLVGLAAAELVSLTGSAMTFVALPWFVLATTGSTARMGWVLAAELVPMGLLGIPSGTLVARLGAKRTMLVADAARGPLLAVVPVLHWTGHLSFAALLATSFAVGCFAAPYMSSSRLVIPEVAGEDERRVPRSARCSPASTSSRRSSGRCSRGSSSRPRRRPPSSSSTPRPTSPRS